MSVLQQYLMGFRTAGEGFVFLARNPLLWRFGLWPVLVNIVVGFAVWFGAFEFGRHAWNQFATGLPIAWWASVVEWAGLVILILTTLAMAMILFVLLQGVFCAWFFSHLARRVELALGASDSELCELPLSAQVLDALRAAARLLLVNVLLLLLLHLLPGVGSVAAVVISLYVNAWILGAEYLSYPMELRGLRLRERKARAREFLPATLGLGTVVCVLLLVPFVGAVFQTTAVVGAVLMHRRLTGLPAPDLSGPAPVD